MKRFLLFMVGPVVGLGLVSLQVFAADDVQLNTPTVKLSYSLGVKIAQNFKAQGIEVAFDDFVRGFSDGLSGTKTVMNDEQMKSVLLKFREARVEMQKTKQKGAADDNKKAGEAFLSENKSKEGVVILKNGLQFKILEKGTGEKPNATDEVTVDYKGTFIDGREFDSGKGVAFPVNQVIAGWTQILPLMPVGSTWEVYVPSELAYGKQGMGPIPPNSTLIFKIHLISVKKTG